MRDKLLKELEYSLITLGIDPEIIRSNFVMILNNYEVQKRCTEIAIPDESAVEKYIKMFLVNKRVSGRTERTLKHYKNELERFFREIPKSPLEVTSDDIKMFLAIKEVRDHVSKITQQNSLRVLSSFFEWMIRDEHIAKNPMHKVERIKLKKKPKEAFTETQIELLRFQIDDDIRLLCIFELLLSTWCRVSEIAQIKLKDISEDKETVLVHGKGDKDRICYINAKAKICLTKYLQERTDDNEYLFANSKFKCGDKKDTQSTACKKYKVKPRDWWKAPEIVSDNHIDVCTIEAAIRKLGEKAGVENTHPHRFRRTGATFALRKGMPIEQVSKLLGHESIETTQIYLDISEDELANAHRKFV